MPKADDFFALAEHVAETLDIGPGTRVFEVDCGDGAFLFPFQQNDYVVGGSDADANAIALALERMPDGAFHVATATSLDPAVPWHVVVWRVRHEVDGALSEVDFMRGVLARMFAKATHAIALLGVPEQRREWMMHALVEIGASAVQFETASSAAPGDGQPAAFHVFARV